MSNNFNKNHEGYSDPTPAAAMNNLDELDKRFYRLLHSIFTLCDLAGFKVKGRIAIIDKETGRVWK